MNREIRRHRNGAGFRYARANGEPVDPATRRRIKSLTIPPAWTHVRIATNPRTPLQATGRDRRGRKQYIYHQGWREERDAAKFTRMSEFGRLLPAIRQRVEQDIRTRGLAPARVTAAAVRILDRAAIRVGNDRYARQNGTFGLSTLRSRHVRVDGASVQFRFAGKGGKKISACIEDKAVARVVRACGDLPGPNLFQFVDEDGNVRRVRSESINDYIRQAAGREFSAKDFRTWTASVLAASLLKEEEVPEQEAARKRIVSNAVRQVAEALDNTPTVCRQCYIHPGVLLAYEDGALRASWRRNRRRWLCGDREPAERLLLWVLSRWPYNNAVTD